MKTSTALLTLGLLSLGGCASYPSQFKDFKVPAINAEGWTFEHTDGAGSVNLSAAKIISDGNGVTAIDYARDVSYPQWHDKIRIKSITFPSEQVVSPVPKTQ